MRCLPLVLVASVCCGCSFLRSDLGARVDLAGVDALEPGRTRRAEVLASLGPPLDLEPHAGGVAFLYEHVLIEERQLGISLEGLGRWFGIREGALFKLSLGRTSSQREAALLLFDVEGILVSVDSRAWGETLGKGGSVQLFVAASQVVDYGPLREGPRQFHWGFELLEPLPAGLNRAHRADLELRGTPVRSGQKTLELRPWGEPGRR